jgi:hypothetical protein
VLDGVGVIRTSFLNVHHAEAASFLAVAIIIVGRGCNLLKTLLVPLPATLGALLSVLDGDVGSCLPTVAQGHANLGRLFAGAILGSDTA